MSSFSYHELSEWFYFDFLLIMTIINFFIYLSIISIDIFLLLLVLIYYYHFNINY